MSREPIRLHTIAPHSKKNRGVILCPNSKSGRARNLKTHIHLPSDEARDDERQVKLDAELVVGFDRRPHFPDEDVRVSIVVNSRHNTMSCEFEAIGERPKGFAGRRRDLHSHLDALFDAIEEVVYQNDNQVAEIHIYRNIDE